MQANYALLISVLFFFITSTLIVNWNNAKPATHWRLLQEAESPQVPLPDHAPPTSEYSGSDVYPPSDPRFWGALAVAGTLILIGFISSGMTIGYLAIDELQLEINRYQGTPQQKKQADAILAIVNRHHLLLCTLLITSSICAEATPIFFNKVVPPALAVLISVLFQIFTGEIIPQAICTGPKQIYLAETFAPVVRLLMILLWPLAYPLSRALDAYFGEHDPVRYQKHELKGLIELHGIKRQQHRVQQSVEHGFTEAEINMITSTIDLREIPVVTVMVPVDQVFSLNENNTVSKDLITRIVQSGYSYIVLYRERRDKIVGTIKTKSLLDWETTKQRLGDLSVIRPAVTVYSDTSLLEMLMIFKQWKTKIAFVIERVHDSSQFHSKMSSFDIRKSQFRELSHQVHEESGKSVLGLISFKGVVQAIMKNDFHDQDQHIHLKTH